MQRKAEQGKACGCDCDDCDCEDDEDEDAEGMPEALSAENADGAQSGAAEDSAENESTVGA